MTNYMPAVYVFGPLFLFTCIPVALVFYGIFSGNMKPAFKFYGWIFGVKYE